MKLVSADVNNIVLEIDAIELSDIVSAVSSVREEYKVIDQAMLDVPLERIESLDNKLSNVLADVNRRRERASKPTPTSEPR